jgi:hypothetical protein
MHCPQELTALSSSGLFSTKKEEKLVKMDPNLKRRTYGIEYAKIE